MQPGWRDGVGKVLAVKDWGPGVKGQMSLRIPLWRSSTVEVETGGPMVLWPARLLKLVNSKLRERTHLNIRWLSVSSRAAWSAERVLGQVRVHGEATTTTPNQNLRKWFKKTLGTLMLLLLLRQWRQGGESWSAVGTPVWGTLCGFYGMGTCPSLLSIGLELR